MATVISAPSGHREVQPRVPPLYSGDRLTQAEFHRRYLAQPDDTTFELIGGIVYMASPMRRAHGVYHVDVSTLLGLYVAETPGVEAADNATVILDEDNEPQPDLYLRILPDAGGRSETAEDDYVLGGPELLVEIAHSTVAIDLHAKKESYQNAGVLEYVVLCIEERQVRWFDLPADRPFEPDPDGIIRSRMFPGLWIDPAALIGRSSSRSLQVLRQGLASTEHQQSVERLRK
jgi:hypothetical protein